jgi:hypothetical protein
MPSQTIRDDTIVYRSIRKGWVISGALSFAAFLLSPRDMEHDPPQLSVSSSAGSAYRSLTNAAGLAALNVGRIRALEDLSGRDLQLDVTSTPTHDPFHCGIVGLPPRAEDMTEANTAAERLLSITEFQPGAPSGMTP